MRRFIVALTVAAALAGTASAAPRTAVGEPLSLDPGGYRAPAQHQQLAALWPFAVAAPVTSAAVPPADVAATTRLVVPYAGPEAPGTIIIATESRRLYLVQPGGTALRYIIGVGRDGFAWTGTHKVSRKQEWPDWTPPAEMLKRRPDLPRHMTGGEDNPLGARALYLGATVYRIHGSNEPDTIGQAVSSGCFRMLNTDVVDLYDRVQVGAKVIVR